MLRGVRVWAAGAFVLALGALLPFWAVKGTEPRGNVALWLLYGALAASPVIWLVATLLLRRTDASAESRAFRDFAQGFAGWLRSQEIGAPPDDRDSGRGL